MVAEAPLLWCVGVVHRFAELDLSGDQATSLSVTADSWAFSLPKALGLLGPPWKRVWHSNAWYRAQAMNPGARCIWDNYLCHLRSDHIT